MVAHVLRLRIALLAAGWRLSLRRSVGLAVLLLLTVGLGGLLLVSLDRLAVTSPDALAPVLIVVAAALLTAFVLVSLVAGFPDQLDPRRFRTTGATIGMLRPALLVGMLASGPSLGLIVLDAGVAVIAIRAGFSVPWVIIGAVAHVLTTLLWSRAVMAARTLVLPESRSYGAVVVVLLVVLGTIPAAISAATDPSKAAALGEVAEIVAMSPLGAAGALGSAFTIGGTAALVAALVTLGFLVIGLLFADGMLQRSLVSADVPVTVRTMRGLGWFSLLPSTAAGAIAARSMVYWFADARYLANLVIIPVAGFVPIIPLMIAGMPLETLAMIPVPLMALVFGWLPHNDLAYDASALWMHIAGGVRGRADRFGRLLPTVVLAVPTIAVGSVLTGMVTGSVPHAAVTGAVATAALFAGLGLSSVSSVLFPYQTSLPGDGPFQQPQRSDSSGTWGQVLVIAFAVVAAAPTGWLGLRTLNGELALWVPLVCGAGTALVVLIVGVLVGGAIYDRRAPALMEFARVS